MTPEEMTYELARAMSTSGVPYREMKGRFLRDVTMAANTWGTAEFDRGENDEKAYASYEEWVVDYCSCVGQGIGYTLYVLMMPVFNSMTPEGPEIGIGIMMEQIEKHFREGVTAYQAVKRAKGKKQ